MTRQVIGRTFRLGQQKVVAYRLVAADTYEERRMHSTAEWLAKILFEPDVSRFFWNPKNMLSDFTNNCSDTFFNVDGSGLVWKRCMSKNSKVSHYDWLLCTLEENVHICNISHFLDSGSNIRSCRYLWSPSSVKHQTFVPSSFIVYVSQLWCHCFVLGGFLLTSFAFNEISQH